ncbi:MAG TPA: shikimate dehydrogenase [Candidatus Dormibacteraeota bacterium]|nr:shikimate dehydrogenase [Candidatus Dormibacteraeota bacterium]
MSTAQSAAVRLFPAWAKEFGVDDVHLVGCDLPVGAEERRYRDVVDRIKRDDRAVGALITTHKIDLFEACRDLFDDVDAYAGLCEETSCLAKRGSRLVAFATDPVSSRRAFDDFHGSQAAGDVLCLGGGGSATAITVQLIEGRLASRITVVDRSPDRLARIRAVHQRVGAGASVDYVENGDPITNDRLVGELPASSLVINATGLGKDLPGSPITGRAVFPEDGYAWDVNYRGDLSFLRQARAQSQTRHLHIEDGWRYFIHGWAVVMGHVFDINVEGELTDRLSAIAESERPESDR